MNYETYSTKVIKKNDYIILNLKWLLWREGIKSIDKQGQTDHRSKVIENKTVSTKQTVNLYVLDSTFDISKNLRL